MIVSVRIFLLFFFVPVLSTNLAGAIDDTIGQGMAVGFFTQYVGLQDDFDGESELSDEEARVLLPEVENNWGAGIYFDFIELDKKGYLDLQLGYVFSRHDVTFGEALGEAELHQFFMNFKCRFFRNQVFQPYVLAGLIPYALFTVKDGSATETDVADARFECMGTGFNFGCGLVVQIPLDLSLTIGVTDVLLFFGEVEGAAGQLDTIEGVTQYDDYVFSNTIQYQVGLAYTFH